MAELRARIAAVVEAGERMDRVDYFGRQWVAALLADVDVLADALALRLDREASQ